MITPTYIDDSLMSSNNPASVYISSCLVNVLKVFFINSLLESASN